MKTLSATFVSLFPESTRSIIQASILGRAVDRGLVKINEEQIRNHARDKHSTVDDAPYGGGAGQLLKVDVVARAIASVKNTIPKESLLKSRVILTDPKGKIFNQNHAKRLANFEHLIFVCGRYEGIDSRIEHYVDETFSIGDYILTGGELPALVMLDAISRELPGVLGNDASNKNETFTNNLIEHKQYTRPREFDGHEVPEIFFSGHHANIASYRLNEQIAQTKILRPDLLPIHESGD